MTIKIQKELITGPEGNIELEALWQNENAGDPDTDTVAIICHPNPLYGGTMSNKVVTTMYRFARDHGMHAVRFNFRCAGRSEGEHDYGKGEIDDTMAVIQWVSLQTKAKKIWLAGFSFGGYVAARVAEQLMIAPYVWELTEMSLAKVVLIAPSVESNDVSDLTLPTKKTLQIYGDADEVIKPSSMQKFAESKQIETHIVSGASHFFHGQLTELKERLEEHAQV